MGKVFKALEKSGIDASSMGDETQLDISNDEHQRLDIVPDEQPHEEFDGAKQVDDKPDQKNDTYKKEVELQELKEVEVPRKESIAFSSPVHTQPSPKEKGKQSGPWDERLVKVTAPDSFEAESFRTLRSRILYPLDGRPVPKTILVTSSAPNEGKGFVASNLGISLARGMDQHSLLVDCDLRRPSLAKMFGLSNEFGLVNCLQEDKGVEHFLQKTSIDKLTLLASGKSPVNPAELLGSSRMENIIHELADRYDDRMIIFDSAPGQVAPESFVLSQHVDCVVLVVRYGWSNRNNIMKLIHSIGKEKIIGIVFNGVKTTMIENKVFGDYDSYGEYYTSEE